MKALWIVGAALLGWGFGTSPSLAVTGSLVLFMAGVLQVTSDGRAAKAKPGRIAIARYPGCWDVPLAFFLRHGGQGLLFYRASDETGRELPEQYCVIAVPKDSDERSLRHTRFMPPDGSRLLGVVPLEQLRSDLSGGDHIDAAPVAALCCGQQA